MKVGDPVIINKSITAQHMFPPKYHDPEIISIEAGMRGTIEAVYRDGNGIVRFENGKRVMMSLNRFVPDESTVYGNDCRDGKCGM